MHRRECSNRACGATRSLTSRELGLAVVLLTEPKLMLNANVKVVVRRRQCKSVVEYLYCITQC